MSKHAPIIILAMALAGCATASQIVTVGKDFDATGIDQKVQKDVTTKEQVYEKFGQPYEKTINASGEVWQYMYVRTTADAIAVSTTYTAHSVAAANTLEKKLLITFDESGIVREIKYTISGGGGPSTDWSWAAKRYGLKLHERGTVLSVENDSPADAAGLRRGDLILTINWIEFEKADVDAMFWNAHLKKETLTFEIKRRDEKMTVYLNP